MLPRTCLNGKYKLLKNSLGNNLTANVSDIDFMTFGGLTEWRCSKSGCMESIVHYSMMLLKDHAAGVDANQLIEKTRRLLRELEIQDPFRRQRYRELGGARHPMPLFLLVLLTIRLAHRL